MEFRDLKKQYEVLKPQIDAAIAGVVSSSHFISGPQVAALEEKLAAYVGVKHCITCANGTDALTLALMAWDVGPGDAVFVPDFTFFSSGECPAYEGATPIFVDVDPVTYNIDPDKLRQAIEQVRAEGELTPRAVVAVDLFGQPADYDRILPLCRQYGLLLLEDGAQGFGGALHGKKACAFGDIATTSFFPAKPLGCYGDGGAIFTDNDDWAALIRSLAVHGKSGQDKYNNIRIGMNSRLDTLQAAVLDVKLQAFREQELQNVNRAAAWYDEALQGSALTLPRVMPDALSSWAQYTVQLPAGTDRAAVQAALKAQGIPTMVYYAKPMHCQGAFAGTRSARADCPVSIRLCTTVLSLPLHPYMTQEQVQAVAQALTAAIQQ